MNRLFSASLLLSLALASAASAWVLEEDGYGHPLYWKEMPVTYHLVSNNVPGGGAGEDAVHRAFRSWDEASSNVSYRFGGYVSTGSQRYDERNVVYWIHDAWPYDSRLAAVTFHYYDTRDGHLVDADIVFNGARYAWTVGESGYDIENSAAHEVGHFGGLGHSSDAEATMYSKTASGETKKRTLSADDRAGLDALYGGGRSGSSSGVAGTGGNAAGVESGGGGGCSIDGRSGGAGPGQLAWLLALFALLWRRRPASESAPSAGTPASVGTNGVDMPERPNLDANRIRKYLILQD